MHCKAIFFTAALLAGELLYAADAQHGAAVMRAEGCLECHTIPGSAAEQGSTSHTTAPDLGQRLAPNYTVPTLASALWNHTPAMWARISSQAMAQPTLREADWEDVFLYLYSLQFFDRPALARRGEQVFKNKHCADCHSSKTGAVAKPVTAWPPMDGPVMLIYQMWNHASSMKKELTTHRKWSTLTGQDLQDLTAYFQNIQRMPRNVRISLSNAAEGGIVVGLQCGGCHAGTDSLAVIVHNKTLMDIGAALWNHLPQVKAITVISPEEMRQVVAYTWELQYRGPAGRVGRGEQVFEDKGCLSCHRSPVLGSIANPLAESPRPGKIFTPFSMVALASAAGREMHRQMQEKPMPWPQLSPEDIADLVAYMNTLHH